MRYKSKPTRQSVYIWKVRDQIQNLGKSLGPTVYFTLKPKRKTKKKPEIPLFSCIYLVNCSTPNPDTTVQESPKWDTSLHLPLWVPDTEKTRIESNLNKWVDTFETSGVDIASISSLLKKPLRPLWISQKTVIWLNEVPDHNSWDFTPIILISASASNDIYRQKKSSEFSWNYIAGAGDDEESWARGLTPPLFWNNVYDLINSGPDVCNQMVANIVERDRVFRAQRGQNAPQFSVKLTKVESTWSAQFRDQPLDIVMENGINGDLLDDGNGIYWLGLTDLAVCSTGYGKCSVYIRDLG
ncbi:putative tRNA A64-2'-O-ribosylphosphate transferase, rit1 domain-containing protein [Helianthus annuus]|nr:putative tRNA A64-2'-O-ribosylphosphate transferase, rit1 domain-containing protein [Helianthus annuus]KAJ0705739.1 putative tRNA A64-2'-O-ribosylphosphate transferase, rit1 domain-containing protein [Helianthus annuus]